MATLLPPHASIHKWKLLPEILLRALFNPLVVVTIMTAISLIIGVLAIAPKPISKTVFAACVIIGLFGLLAIFYELGRLRRLDIAKTFINNLLVEGDQLTLFIIDTFDDARRYPRDYPSDTVDGQDKYLLMVDWCTRVEDVLRKYLNEGYVTRFHLGGSLEQDRRSMTIWKARHRLETLASFLNELR